MAEIDRQSGAVTTTNATPQTICTIPLTAGMSALLESKVTAKAGDLNIAWYKVDVGIKRASAGGAVVGLTASTAQEDAALVTASVAVVASGNDVLVQVTGIAATTINWSYDILITYT